MRSLVDDDAPATISGRRTQHETLFTGDTSAIVVRTRQRTKMNKALEDKVNLRIPPSIMLLVVDEIQII